MLQKNLYSTQFSILINTKNMLSVHQSAIMFIVFWDSSDSWVNFPFTTSETKRDY